MKKITDKLEVDEVETCECCFQEVSKSLIFHCKNKHPFCKNCLLNAVKQPFLKEKITFRVYVWGIALKFMMTFF